MSHFGDNTLREDLLGWIELEQREHEPTICELIKAVHDVLNAIIETAEFQEQEDKDVAEYEASLRDAAKEKRNETGHEGTGEHGQRRL